MIYQGNSISVSLLEDGIAKLNYDNQTESVNKFDQATIKEFGEAVTALEQSSDVKGLIVTSGKKFSSLVRTLLNLLVISKNQKARLLLGYLTSTKHSTVLKTCLFQKLRQSMAHPWAAVQR